LSHHEKHTIQGIKHDIQVHMHNPLKSVLLMMAQSHVKVYIHSPARVFYCSLINSEVQYTETAKYQNQYLNLKLCSLACISNVTTVQQE
jgi:hypothetical protein